ncbi:MAG TPA: cysteine hydrolase family protein [Gemmatimonadales bacterium]|nr:cysteine hydrolase family protein [Gemmatimonadales bacterium]
MATPLIFWDVDTQHDFMRADGLLYVPGSEEIIETVGALTDHAHAHRIPIVASADDHVPGHRELSDTPDFRETFPPHCMRGTPGQAKIAETALRNPLEIQPEAAPASLRERIRRHDGDFLLLKHWFDVFTNENVDLLLDVLAPERIVLYGVALDVCDRYAIDGLLQHLPARSLWLVEDATRAIDPGAGRSLVEGWRASGVNVVSAADVLAGRAPR